jgi:hypothetical protein
MKMPMNPVNSVPDRLPGDRANDLHTQKSGTIEVTPAYYKAFLALNDDEMETLVRAALNAQAEEARRLIRAESTVIEASTRLTQFATKTLSLIAVGLARFNHFAQIELLTGVGSDPQPEVHDALLEKIAKARTIVEWIVRDFIQNQIDDGKPVSPCKRRASPLRRPTSTADRA